MEIRRRLVQSPRFVSHSTEYAWCLCGKKVPREQWDAHRKNCRAARADVTGQLPAQAPRVQDDDLLILEE